MIRFEPWLVEVLNQVSLDKLAFELIQNPMEPPAVQVTVRGLVLEDVASGGVILDEMTLTLTFPTSVPVLEHLDMATLRQADVKLDRLLVKISLDWLNKVLASAPKLSAKGLTAQLEASESQPSRLTVAGSFKKTVSFSLDFHLGIQGNLLHIKVDEIRFLKLPLFSVPGLKGFILNAIKEALPAPAVRMNHNEIFVDVQSQLPLSVALRWRRFESEGLFIILEAGS